MLQDLFLNETKLVGKRLLKYSSLYFNFISISISLKLFQSPPGMLVV